jgi:acyl carrier protein
MVDRDVILATELTDVICAVVAAVNDTDCQPSTSLPHLGLDSLHAAETAAVLEHALQLAVPLETILGAPTPRTAAATLLAQWQAEGHPPEHIRARLAAVCEGTGVM